jgi:hypothetical protein
MQPIEFTGKRLHELRILMILEIMQKANKIIPFLISASENTLEEYARLKTCSAEEKDQLFNTLKYLLNYSTKNPDSNVYPSFKSDMQNFKKTLIATLILTSVIFVFSCSRDKTYFPVYGTLRNYTGLDGCGWVIELSGPAKMILEPSNLSSFKIHKKNGAKVWVTYIPQNAMSICMVGPVVKIISIVKVK